MHEKKNNLSENKNPLHFCNLTINSLKERLSPSFRANQVFDWIYKKQKLCFDEMTNIPLNIRSFLKENFIFPSLKIQKTVHSEDGETIKFLFKLSDGFLIESVLIISKNRRTVCLSSQVGCHCKCFFCASGRKGFFRNLSSGEIIEQILHVNQYLAKKNERTTHIVFMGMGEPFHNYNAVIASINRFNDPDCFNISQRRITISTVGIIEKINLLQNENLKINLTLSLHAADQKIREKIIPYAKKYPINDLVLAMNAYFEKSKRDITFEYILIENLNDGIQDAKNLFYLVKDLQCCINLIPYNPVSGCSLKRSSNERIKAFHNFLLSKNIPATRRYTKGKDIAAACGQLALMQN